MARCTAGEQTVNILLSNSSPTWQYLGQKLLVNPKYTHLVRAEIYFCLIGWTAWKNTDELKDTYKP